MSAIPRRDPHSGHQLPAHRRGGLLLHRPAHEQVQGAHEEVRVRGPRRAHRRRASHRDPRPARRAEAALSAEGATGGAAVPGVPDPGITAILPFMVPADHRGRRAPSHHRRPQIGRPFGRSRRRPRRIATALSPSGRRYEVGGRRGGAGGGGCGLPWPCRPRRPSARPRPWGRAAEPCGDRIPVQGASPAPGRSRFSQHTASGPTPMPDPAAPGAPPGARERRPTRKIAGEPPRSSLNPRDRHLTREHVC